MHAHAHKRSQRGFTIIELAVTIIIILVVTGALVVSAGAIRGASLKTTARRIDGAFRYVYRMASSQSVPFRMVFEMSGEEDDEDAVLDKWWAEQLAPNAGACGNFVVHDARRKKIKVHTEKKRSKGRMGSPERKAKEQEEESCPEEEQDAEGRCPATGFVQVETKKLEPNLKPQEMPKGMRIAGVMTTHQDEVQRRGKAYVYIFPNGLMEKAYVYLADGDDIYTVETYPLLGKVKIHHKELEPREVLKDED